VYLPVVYGDDHVLVPEYEYQDFIVPVLRNSRSAVDRQLIPIERDPYPERQRQQTSFYSAKKIRRAYAVRLTQAYSANIPSLTKFSLSFRILA